MRFGRGLLPPGVRGRISVVLACVTAAAFILSGAAGLGAFSTLVNRAEDEKLADAKSALLEGLDAISRRNLALARMVSLMPEVRHLMAEGDRIGLHTAMLPIYDALRAEFGIDNLHFHTPATVTLLRMHKPEQYGDDLRTLRPMIAEVNATLEPRLGLERGVNGIPIRGAVPVFSDGGQHLGAVEFGSFISDGFLARLVPTGITYVVFAPKDGGWEAVASSRPGSAPPDRSEIERIVAGGAGEHRNANGVAELIAATQLTNYSNRETVAVAEIVIDVTEMRMLFDQARAGIFVTALLLLLVGGIAAWHSDRWIARPLDVLIRSMQRLTADRRASDVPYRDREDQVGVMARAVHAFGETMDALVTERERLRRVVEDAPFPIMVHAEDGEVVHLSQAWTEFSGYPRDAIRTTRGWVELAYGDSWNAIASDIDRLYLLDQPVDEGEYKIQAADGQTRVWNFRSSPIGLDGRGRRLVVSMAADLTDRKEMEERLRLLMREVDHRAKNALAAVQSVVMLSRTERPELFVEAVQGRVAALARAHTLLASAHWSGANLAEMVRAELQAYAGDERLEVSGPSVAIAAEVAQAFSMVLHELTTNATKHGALSVSTGRLRVTWTAEPDGSPLVLSWQERDGPLTSSPTRSGFGMTLLQATVKGQLRGWMSWDWNPAGLRCRIELPPECFVASGVQPVPAQRPDQGPEIVITAAEGARVLVVEDEALTAFALSQVLEDRGYRVLGPVGRVQDAINLARSASPDAAVLDVNLFGQASFPVAEVLNSMGVPYLFCTGYRDLERAPMSVRQATVLTKPINVDRLLEEISRLLAAPGHLKLGIALAP